MEAYEVRYEIRIEDEEEAPEGFFASGNDEADAETCREIRRRVACGDAWAWCVVTVVAIVEIDGFRFEGRDSLGGCCYRDEADFRAGGYFDQMRDGALEELRRNLKIAKKRGEAASVLLCPDTND